MIDYKKAFLFLLDPRLIFICRDPAVSLLSLPPSLTIPYFSRKQHDSHMIDPWIDCVFFFFFLFRFRYHRFCSLSHLKLDFDVFISLFSQFAFKFLSFLHVLLDRVRWVLILYMRGCGCLK